MPDAARLLRADPYLGGLQSVVSLAACTSISRRKASARCI